MHFSKIIASIVVLVVTGALATSNMRDEGNDLAEVPRETEFDTFERGMDAAPGCDESEMDSADQMDNFSPVRLSSLEWGAKRICLFGPCLRRHSSRRRCPRGYSVLGYKRCGWWRVRALCCRPLGHSRRWPRNQLADGEAEDSEEDESAEQHLDELDN
ncbi:hypothetical protein BDN70DRAFT_224561 [Pholiota conissans]|uniref:Uncharacterized protein n=1 Tax=Pholiota conissans TaxID=109636 RepID=A0A9P6CWY6_9AGAR|nr:hypothetical protein BDN70DRAFT_224561 [Pholiota conissans]